MSAATVAPAPAGATAAASRWAALRSDTPWGTVTVLGVVLAAVNTFWVVAIAEAIGSIQRNQTPFATWLKYTVALAPVFAVVVALVLQRLRRRRGDLDGARTVVAATVAVGLVASALGLGVLAASSAYDYRLQSRELAVSNAKHHQRTGTPAAADVAGRNDATCDQLCTSRRATLMAHVKSTSIAVPVLLATNLVATGWVVALAGGTLVPRRRRSAA